jgi:hypothetical protein
VDITEPVKVVKICFMRFQILTVTSMKMTAFWDIAPCNLTEVDRRFRDVYCPIVMTLIMEAVRTSETSVYFKETTRRCIPEDCYLQYFF